MWAVYIFLSKFFDSIATIVQKKFLKGEETNPVAFAVSFQFTIGIMFLIFGFLISDLKLNDNGTFKILNIIIMMFLYGFGNVFYFKSLKIIEASKFAIISATSSVFTIISSTIFLKESLTLEQCLGGALVLFGILVVNFKKMKLSFGIGELFALLGAASLGFEITNDKYLLEDQSLYLFLALASVLPSLLMAVIYFKNMKAVRKILEINGFWKFFIFCTIYALQAVFFFIGLQKGENSSIVVVVNTAGRIITVIMSIVILKETEDILKKLFGVVIVIVGLLLI